MVEGSGFENRRTVRYRGFESHHLLPFFLFFIVFINTFFSGDVTERPKVRDC